MTKDFPNFFSPEKSSLSRFILAVAIREWRVATCLLTDIADTIPADLARLGFTRCVLIFLTHGLQDYPNNEWDQHATQMDHGIVLAPFDYSSDTQPGKLMGMHHQNPATNAGAGAGAGHPTLSSSKSFVVSTTIFTRFFTPSPPN
ncbi:hypothetical protein ACLOJK_039784 [Asimina triloba]